jgi:uncharacterized membrane protein YphA (DoxX/SURF4 family)
MSEVEPAAERRTRLGVRVGRTAGVVLGLVMLSASLTKAIDPVGFAESIALEGLDFLVPADVLSPLVIVLEAALGFALILGLRHLWILVPTALLTGFFLFLTARAYYWSETGQLEAGHQCGCFGNLVERSPAEAFWQDLGLLLPGLVLSFFGRPRGALPRRRTVAVGGCAAATLAFTLLAPDLALDDIATRLDDGMQVSDICAGTGLDRTCLDTHLPEVELGEHLVIIADLADAAFAARVEALNAWIQGGAAAQVWLLSDAEEATRQAWFWEHAPAFEVRPAPHGLLRPLYRRLPRSFRVRDGTVTETYDGLPPLGDDDGSP